jgi:DNA-binding response OmpR family regulator
LRRLVRALLTDGGHVVAEAGDGVTALQKVRQQPPDLLVLDVIMPSLDGYGVLKALKESGLSQDIKVLMLSAKSGETDIVKGYKLGADHYMTKPFGADEFLNIVKHLLDTKKTDLKRNTQDELEKAQLLSRLESLIGDL